MSNMDGTYSQTYIAKALGVTTAAVYKTGEYFNLESKESGRGKNREYPESSFEIFQAIASLRTLDLSFQEIKELVKIENKIFDAAKYYFYEGNKGKVEKQKPPKGLKGYDRVGALQMLLLTNYCPASTHCLDIDNWEFQKDLKAGKKEAVELDGLLKKRNQWLKNVLDESSKAITKIREKEKKIKETVEMIKSAVGV